MTPDEIIRMAREAGLAEWHESIQQHGFKFADVNNLERFAALVAASERERMKWDGIHTCSDVCDKPACVARRNAVLAEREACAKVCDKYAEESSNPMNFAENCAAAIRQRKNK